MQKKVNPHKRPANWADVEKARLDGYTFGVEFAANLFLFAAVDKLGMDLDEVQKLFYDFEFYSEQIAKNEVKYPDVVKAVKEEYGFEINMHPGLRSEANKRIN